MEAYDTPENVQAMRMGVDYRFPITCRAFSKRVRPLSVWETVEVKAKAAQRTQDMSKGMPTMLNESTATTIYIMETLQRASTSDVDKTDYSITEYELQKVTPDELQHLYKQYVQVCSRVNPSLEETPTAELQALVDALKKTPKEALPLQLIELSFLQLLNVCRALVLETKGE